MFFLYKILEFTGDFIQTIKNLSKCKKRLANLFYQNTKVWKLIAERYLPI
jgi:hypothetical protein